MSIAAPADGDSRLVKPFYPYTDVRGTLLVPRISNSLGWTAAATAYAQLPAAGKIEFLALLLDVGAIVGMAAVAAQDYAQLTHAIYVTRGTMRALEAGTLVGSAGTYTETDVLSINVAAGVVTYAKNGTTFYTSAVAASGTHYVSAFLYAANDAIYNLTVTPAAAGAHSATGYALDRGSMARGGRLGYASGNAREIQARGYGTSGTLLAPRFNEGFADEAASAADGASFVPAIVGYARAIGSRAIGADVAGYATGRAIDGASRASGIGGTILAKTIIELVGITDLMANQYRMRVSIVSTLMLTLLTEGYTQLPQSIISTLSISSSLSFQQWIQTIVTALGATDTMTPRLRLLASIVSQLAAVDEAAALHHLNASVIEALRVHSAGTLVGASAARETWAVNDDKNAAATRYTNYDFSGFAVFRGVAYGIRADGLYVLDGDDDDGMPIRASMHFGRVRFGTSALKRLGAVYVGASSSGALFLKVTTKEQGSFLYKARDFDADVLTQRFDVGRGLKSSYIEFELFNGDGEDFSLDAIEFMPITLDRRI